MNFSTFAEKYRGRIGVIISILIILIANQSKFSILIGFFISSLGNILRIWASGYIKKEIELATSGPYGYTRNPLYLGNFLIGLGFCIASQQIISHLLFLAYFLSFYIPIIKREEERMFHLFKDSYLEYKRKVPVFFPKIKGTKGNSPYSWKNLNQNKEWRAISSTLLFYLIIILKALVLK